MVAAKLERVRQRAERTDGEGEAGWRRLLRVGALVPGVAELRFPLVAPGAALGPRDEMAGKPHDPIARRRIGALAQRRHRRRHGAVTRQVAARRTVAHQAIPGRRPRRAPRPNTTSTPGCRSSAALNAAAPAPVIA